MRRRGLGLRSSLRWMPRRRIGRERATEPVTAVHDDGKGPPPRARLPRPARPGNQYRNCVSRRGHRRGAAIS
jgi:hypothetical protein